MYSEREAFLKAIEASPLDRDLRGVYADWLEEHDCPEEADRQRKYIDARLWLTQFAKDTGGTGDDEGYYGPYREYTFEDMVQAGHNWLDGSYWGDGSEKYWDGEYEVQQGSEHARNMMHSDETKALFWRNWQVVTGVAVEADKQGTVFSCSC